MAVAGALAAVVASVVLAPAGDIAWVEPGADGWARGPFAEARITSVQQTQAVKSGHARLETSQVFVLVRLEVTVHRRLAPMGDISLLTGDGCERLMMLTLAGRPWSFRLRNNPPTPP